MPQEIARHIVSYLEYLGKSEGLRITLHCLDPSLAPYMHILGPYNIHRCPYCLMVKTSRQAWDRCIARQKRVRAACRETSLFGMCYAGVEEYVFPVSPGEDRGFICVGGYGTDPEKAAPRIRAVAKAYEVDYDDLLGTYRRSMRRQAPVLRELEPLIRPVCNLLRLIRILSPYRDGAVVPEDEDAVYGSILSYIHDNDHSEITAGMLAERWHCSVSYISRFFKRRSGQSVSAYVNRLRMEEAGILLREAQLPVQRVAGLVGFADTNYFNFCFKKYSGLSPGRYKRETSGNDRNFG